MAVPLNGAADNAALTYSGNTYDAIMKDERKLETSYPRRSAGNSANRIRRFR